MREGSPPPGRKTYSRMTSGRRVPTEYEIVSSDLHYNYPNRFELGGDNDVIEWYRRHREGSIFSAGDWELFSDPRRTTYRGYNELQDRNEDVIDGLLRQIDGTILFAIFSADYKGMALGQHPPFLADSFRIRQREF